MRLDRIATRLHGRWWRLLVVTAGAAAAVQVAGLQAPPALASTRPPSVAAPQHGTAAAAAAHRRGSSPVKAACPKPRPGFSACMSLVRTNVKTHRGLFAPDTAPPGYGPSDFQSAYNLPSAAAGSGETVAIVDAGDDPTAEADLATYRAQYGLPACTTANGCFEKVNQDGQQGNYPPEICNSTSGCWPIEESLDVDMVSAICPNCHIILVEANSPSNANLGTAENEAVTLGAKYVSNSWASCEYASETSSDRYFNHPGVAITAAGGDNGYDNYQRGCHTPNYPAASPYVTSVGGTTLTQDSSVSRGWAETTWSPDPSATGSGCSRYEPKPAWQHDPGCANRMTNDVSADADPATGAAIYDTTGQGGWLVVGGTSEATPIIAATYALAGSPAAGSYPASYPYLHSSDGLTTPAGLNDITSGTNYNTTCKPSYFCAAGPGYDGPTGLGTPDGVSAVAPASYATVTGTITDAATGKPISGAKVSFGAFAVTADASGRYSTDVAPGSYTLTASAFGYKPQTVAGVQAAQGQTATENFTLDPVPEVTLSGSVTDGSGHGWPLPAKITIAGDPAGPVYTSPYTGTYSVSLPVGATYRLHVAAGYPGYKPVTARVKLGTANQTRDISLSAIQAATCAAPGYTYSKSFEQFTGWTGSTAQDGWNVTDNDGSGLNWQFGFKPPEYYANPQPAGGDDQYAITGDYYQRTGTVDTSLVSPVIDLSSVASPVIEMDSYWYYDPNARASESANVQLSTDGGKTWGTLWNLPAHPFDGFVTVPIPQAAHHADVQVRFDYTGNVSGGGGGWWSLDNVSIGQRCSVVPGGLVAGQVTDANTQAGINGAVVASAGTPSETATTGAVGVPFAGSGFYDLFTASTGSQQFTAARTHYQTATLTADVTADTVTKVNFSLNAGQLSVSSSDVAASGSLGSTMKRSVKLTNTGTAPVTVNLAEVSGGFTSAGGANSAQAGAPLQRIRGAFSPLATAGTSSDAHRASTPTAVPAAAPWTAISPFPIGIADNSLATDPATGLVYSVGGDSGAQLYKATYVYDPAVNRWSSAAPMTYKREAPEAAFISGRLFVVGGVGSTGYPLPQLEIYNPVTGSWAAGASIPHPTYGAGVAVVNGKMYIIGGCDQTGCGNTSVQVYNPASNSWSTAASYPAPVSWESCGAPADLIYCAGGVSGSDTETTSAYQYDPASDTWSPIAPMPVALWGGGYTAANGQLVVSGGVAANSTTLTNQGYAYSPWSDTWSRIPNAPHAVYRGGSACGYYKIGGLGFVPEDYADHLPGYSSCGTMDVPWLSGNPSSFTLQPGQSQTVTVTMNAGDSSITQPGTYTAGLVIENNTPYHVSNVGVTMDVTPPKTWGKITGTVTNLKGKPLAGATLQIVTRGGKGPVVYTVTTRDDGSYGWWLADRYNPLQITVTDSGYTTQTKKANITAGGTTTLNFNLKKT